MCGVIIEGMTKKEEISCSRVNRRMAREVPCTAFGGRSKEEETQIGREEVVIVKRDPRQSKKARSFKIPWLVASVEQSC